MSPLLLVGILTTALADTSHVLQGPAHSPANPQDINSLAYQSNDSKHFWWMADDSALKGAFTFFKECSSKGNCLTQPGFDKGPNNDGLGSIDLAKNPFLNGAAKPKTVLSSFADEHDSIDLAKNPFLNGVIESKTVPSSFTGNGEKVHNENGFLGVQPKKPGFATTHPLSNKKPFPTSPPIGQQSFVLGEDEGKVDETKCNSEDHVCITRELCVNGLVNRKLVREKQRNICNSDEEVCCRITDIENSPKIEIILSDDSKKNYASSINELIHTDDVLASASEFPSSSAKPTRSISNVFGVTPDYSDVNFDSNVRFSSTIQGPGYLPPFAGTTPQISTYKPIIPTTSSPRPCLLGSYLTASGLCESTAVPTCPFGTIRKPDGTCQKIETPRPCPSGTYKSSSGHCESPTTPSCPYGTIKQIDGNCKKVEISTPCPFGTHKSTYGKCVTLTTTRPCPPASYKSASGQCIYITTLAPTPEPCPFGTIRKSDGTCKRTETPRPCPLGTYKSSFGQCITPTRPTPRPCQTGSYQSASGQCIYSTTPAPAPELCPFGSIKQIDGSCQILEPSTSRSCPPSTYKSDSGECIIPSAPTPTCPFGTIIQNDGSCRRPNFISTPRPCGPGTFLGPSGTCETNVYEYSKPCPQGTYKTPSGQCVTSTVPPRPCPPGSHKSTSGQCIFINPTTETCPFGTIRQINGSCKKPEPPSTPYPCGPGTFLTPSGICKPFEHEASKPCPLGTYKSFSGSCILPVTQPTTIKTCPFDTIKQTDGSCRPLRPPTPCPSGTYRSASGQCISLPTPTQTCPFGTIKQIDGSCGYQYPTPITQPCPFGTTKQVDGSCKGPLTSTHRPCPSGTYKTVSGQCIEPPIPVPSCPFGTIKQIDGSCRTPEPVSTSQPCPPGTYKSFSGKCISPNTPAPTTEVHTASISCPFGTVQQIDGSCKNQLEISTLGYEYPKPCPLGQIKTASGDCETKCPFGTIKQLDGNCRRLEPSTSPTTPTPTCRFGTIRQSDGSCVKPTTSREYLPPTITAKPTEPTGYVYEKPTPTSEPTTLITSQNNINTYYVPAPTEDNTGEYANNNKFFIPTTRNPLENNEPPAVGCAAALKCVQEIYCTADGFVSPVPVVLTPQQELFRAPTTVCKDLESGITGKCCRDPNYKDPWPSANLVNGIDDGQYREDNFYGQKGINSNRLVRAPNATRSVHRATRRSEKYELQAKCGVRNLDTEPKGESSIDANFAEYPWQAMILRDSTRSLLCGGAIIRNNAVLTAAHCIEGLETSDILIKGGEWKLGIDEEPLPFQIVKVAAILRHPEYKAGSYVNDLAVLVLQEKLRVAKNIGTICLPQPNQIPTANCKATGWGKRILQLHAKGALMHHIDLKIMDNEQCREKLSKQFKNSNQNYSPNTLCGLSDIDQCKVDYGSALACANDQGQYTLSGIYTWDTGCKQNGQIGGYVAPDVEWIERTLRKSRKELRLLDREYLLKSKNLN